LTGAIVVALGVALAAVVGLVFVPFVVTLYELRGPGPVRVDASALSLISLAANVIILVAFAAVWRRE
jgi:hypothetical protein